MSALDTLPNTQSSKVGKTEKTEPDVFRHKSANQRRYEDVRSREYLLPSEVDAIIKQTTSWAGNER